MFNEHEIIVKNKQPRCPGCNNLLIKSKMALKCVSKKCSNNFYFYFQNKKLLSFTYIFDKKTISIYEDKIIINNLFAGIAATPLIINKKLEISLPLDIEYLFDKVNKNLIFI